MSKKGWAGFFSFTLVFAFSTNLLAWSEHPLITYPVAASLAKVRDASPVKAESLEAFVNAEAKKLEAFLAQEEEWAKKNLQWYAPLPASLAFKAEGDPQKALERFSQAIRINPRTGLPLYLQFVPGTDAGGRKVVSAKNISFLQDVENWDKAVFVSLENGELVRPLDILVTASDEPDLLGLDIGLFTDNHTGIGKVYGFGEQPFGNPNLEYGSQAPFHMGFYHEAEIMYTLAGFLKKTYPEYRIHLYKKLSEFAFQAGHPYWGWRFVGWGIHYLADLTQPYHATVLPGVSTAYALWINTIAMTGISGPKDKAIQLVSNRHTAIEKFVQMALQKAYMEKETNHRILQALQAPADIPVYADTIPRAVVAKLARDKAEETDEALEKNMPEQFVSDPEFEIGASPEREQIIERIKAEKGEKAIDNLINLSSDLLKPFGVYGSSYIQTILREVKEIR
jgi:tetratricopeptide (TPR) repeat protein